jgi:hypothetical protein
LEGAVERSEVYDNVEKALSDMIKDERGNIDQMVRKIWKELGGSELKDEPKETKDVAVLPNSNGVHHEPEQSEDDMDVQMDLDSGDEGPSPILQTAQSGTTSTTKREVETKENGVEMEYVPTSRSEQAPSNSVEDKENKEGTKPADLDAMDHEPTHGTTVTVNGVTPK